jgi:hypothetical protein
MCPYWFCARATRARADPNADDEEIIVRTI